jgi:hypothetical protein
VAVGSSERRVFPPLKVRGTALVLNKGRFFCGYQRIFILYHGVVVRWGPCPHSMARPRVADGGTASSYGIYL